jgi:hypothetical protein
MSSVIEPVVDLSQITVTGLAERAAELARELAGPGTREPVVVVVVVTGSQGKGEACFACAGDNARPPWEG